MKERKIAGEVKVKKKIHQYIFVKVQKVSFIYKKRFIITQTNVFIIQINGATPNSSELNHTKPPIGSKSTNPIS